VESARPVIDAAVALYGGGPDLAGNCSGALLGSAIVSGIALPGSATFDFVPDVAIVAINCVSVTVTW